MVPDVFLEKECVLLKMNAMFGSNGIFAARNPNIRYPSRRRSTETNWSVCTLLVPTDVAMTDR